MEHHCYCNFWSGEQCTCGIGSIGSREYHDSLVSNIPVVTDSRVLKGTPNKCLDCSKFGIYVSSKPVPGYNYCDICIHGKIIEQQEVKNTWRYKWFAEPIHDITTDLFHKLDLKAAPINDKLTSTSSVNTGDVRIGSISITTTYSPVSKEFSVNVFGKRSKHAIVVRINEAEALTYRNSGIDFHPEVKDAIKKISALEEKRKHAVRYYTIAGQNVLTFVE